MSCAHSRIHEQHTELVQACAVTLYEFAKVLAELSASAQRAAGTVVTRYGSDPVAVCECADRGNDAAGLDGRQGVRPRPAPGSEADGAATELAAQSGENSRPEEGVAATGKTSRPAAATPWPPPAEGPGEQ